jgi:Tfp pilus assembly protein PilX
MIYCLHPPSRSIIYSQRGVSAIVIALLIMMISVLGISIISMTNIGNMVASNQLTASRAFYIAEAGIERAVREIRDDASATQTTTPTADGYCVTPCLDGYTAAGTGTTTTNAIFYGTSLTNSATAAYCSLTNVIGRDVQIYNFQQRYNLMNTPIKAMEIGMRAIANAIGGTSPTIQLRYTLNGGGSWTNVGSVITLSSATWANPVFVTIPTTPTWAQLLDGTSFRIQAYRTNAGSGGNARTAYIDYLCIRVTLKADAVTEPWYTTFKDVSGNPIAVNIQLGSGVLESAPIDDEHGKVHLNYASQSLLRYLMFECGIADATANTLATNIVTYRGSNWFDTVEEVQQVSGMTAAYYDLIKNYVTVYSWVNPNVQRPTGSRAQININTAPLQVLEAVFDPLGLGATDPATLANAIITRRATTPFSSMISSNPADTSSSFARFLDTQTAYLTATEINYVKENCDASLYNTTTAASWNNGNVTTTEFCYSSNVYSVTSTGKVQNAYRETRRVFEDDGTFTITSGALTLNYWKELVP